MKCSVCKHGETHPGEVTVGSTYLTEQVTRVLLERAEAAVQRGVEIEILRYAA